jgi:TetR/AcrR family transcriptional repressor of nem operon
MLPFSLKIDRQKMFMIIFFFGDSIASLKGESMPYSLERKRDTREKILESARRLFNSKGYSEVSIEEIMRDAGLTHGGFYRHFSSKEELYAAAVRQFLCTKAPADWRKQRKPSRVPKSVAQRTVHGYFSLEHFDDHEGCCPLIGMACDVQRGGDSVKAAYQEVVESLAKVFEDHLDVPQRRERALALVALCVGGMVVARSVRDRDLAEGFRRAAHAEVLRSAGWIEANSSGRQIRRSRRDP